MLTPQPGIFAQGNRAHYHLEFDVDPGADRRELAARLRDFRDLRATTTGVNLIIGFGADLWRTLAGPESMPGELRPFDRIDGIDGKVAPATQHDLWTWCHGDGPDTVFDEARGITASLSGCATLALEQPCFVYRDSRDLTGFVDGTENPPVDEGPLTATIPPGTVGEGGAYVLTQRWRHDLEAFSALDPCDQEFVFGRTKSDSLERDDKPDNAHISRVVIEEHGEELEIYRRSTPWGTVTAHGLYFVAFSAELSRFDKMLARMFGTADRKRDRLTDFSKPQSGSYYFAPSVNALDALAGEPDG
jgi:putative iron-dependent peroxidase